MDYSDLTIQTYDRSAKELAEYFKGIGARTHDIELGLSLAEVEPAKARVVEIGCGDGRDAVEITRRVGRYEGFDPSRGLLELARVKVPDGNFLLADALSYRYPDSLDVVFAFASLLHVNRDDFSKVCRKVAVSLREGGIFFISLKEREQYAEEIKNDKYGERMFYYYTAPLVKELAGDKFEAVHEDHQQIGSTGWLTLALRRR